MKIVSRKDFMALPAGVIFAKISERWIFDSLAIKGDTIVHDGRGIDFYYLTPANITAFDTGEWVLRLNLMAEAGESFPMADAESRDGLFDESEMFMVFEAADLVRLQGMVERALELAKEAESG